MKAFKPTESFIGFAGSSARTQNGNHCCDEKRASNQRRCRFSRTIDTRLSQKDAKDTEKLPCRIPVLSGRGLPKKRSEVNV